MSTRDGSGAPARRAFHRTRSTGRIGFSGSLAYPWGMQETTVPMPPPVAPEAPPPWRAPRWLVPVLVGAALACRIVFSLTGGVYVDEAYTYFLSCGSLRDILTGARPDFNTPTFAVLLHFMMAWTGDWGREPLLLRLPSLLFGAAAVPFVFAVGRRVHGDAAGAWAAALVAVGYACLLSDCQVRAYGLVSLLAAIGLWGRLEMEERGSPPCGWGPYALAVSLLALCHYLGAVLGVALLVTAGVGRRSWRLVAALGPGLVGCALWAVYSFTGPTRATAATRMLRPGLDWSLDWVHTPGYLLGLLVPLHWPPLGLALGVTPAIMQGLSWGVDLGAWLALALGARTVLRRSPVHGAIMLLFVLVPLATVVLGATVGLQPYQHRYAVMLAAGWLVLVVVGVIRCRGGVLLGLAVAANLGVVALFPARPFFWNQDWRTTTRFVEQRQEDGDIILVHVPYGLVGFDFYYAGGGARVDFSRPGVLAFDYSRYQGLDQEGLVPAGLGPDLEGRLGRRRVFLVLNQETASGGQAIREWFGARYDLVDALEQRCLNSWGNTSVYLLSRRSTPRSGPP